MDKLGSDLDKEVAAATLSCIKAATMHGILF